MMRMKEITLLFVCLLGLWAGIHSLTDSSRLFNHLQKDQDEAPITLPLAADASTALVSS